MSYLLVPTQRSSQPSGGLPLNYSNSLSRGLLGAWIPNPASLTVVPEAVFGNKATYAALTGVTLTAGAFGNGVHMNGGNSSTFLSATNDTRQNVGTGAISVAALFVPTDTSSRSDLFCRWQNGTTAGDQFDLIYSLTAGKMTFFVSSGAASGNSGASSQALVAGVPYVVGGSSINSGNTIVYVNGVVGNSAAIGLTLQAAPSAAYRILSNGASGNIGPGSVFGAFVWNRVLTLNEWRALSMNPWQMFASAPRPMMLGALNADTLIGQMCL